MPLSGGTSAKLGDRYEDLWTILCLIELLDEKAEAIQIEPPGPEGVGVELILFKNGYKEYYQSKRQQTKSDKWTISSLGSKSVISHFFNKFNQDQTCKCIFVSIQDVPDLRELSERARSSENVESFKEDFLTSKPLSSAYNDLLFMLSLNENQEKVFAFLSCIEVLPRVESDLNKQILFLIAKLIDGEPEKVRSELVWFIKENLNRNITAFELWNYLEEKGFERLNLAKNTSLISRINENNERYVRNIEYRLIPDKFIKRNESDEIIDALNDQNLKGVLITGEAGSGKSGVLYEVIDKINEQRIPSLVFRVDNLDSGDITPQKIGERLGIKYSPEVALDGISVGKKGVLIIDQLDAVSLASGRLPQLFDCIYELIDNCIYRFKSEIKILLACRNFDVENDRRLKQLSEKKYLKTLKLNRIDTNKLTEFLFEHGIPANTFSELELSLLSLPINLKLFFEIYDEKVGKFDFRTTQDLLEKYWISKQQDVNNRTNKNIRWSSIIYRIVDYMSENQTLNAPKYILDAYDSEQDVLVSEHVLMIENDRYAFFHETFFDYAFSRKFLSDGQKSITQLILSSEQHLFRRVQVRQLFINLRESDFKRYLTELKIFLSSQKIRTHLQHIIYAFLREIDLPTKEEWDIISECLIPKTGNEIESANIWHLIKGSPKWIRFSDKSGHLTNWLNSPNTSLVDEVFYLLYSYKELEPDRVVDILSGLDLHRIETKKRILNLIGRNWDTNDSAKFLNLFIELVTDTEIFNLENERLKFHDLTYGLPKKNPAWACQALGAYLNFVLDESIKIGENSPFISLIDKYRARGDTEFFKTITEEAPEVYFENIYPFFLRCIENNTEDKENVSIYDENQIRDKVWYRYNSFSDYPSKILNGLEESLRLILEKDPSKADELISRLKGTKYANVNALLLKAFQYSGKAKSDEAISYLIENPSLLNLSDSRGRSCIAADLLKVVAGHCSNKHFLKIESLLQSYYPAIYFDKNYYQPSLDRSILSRFGIEQFRLLSSLDSSRISSITKKKIQEFERKFKTKKPIPSHKVNEPLVSAVESPVRANQAEQMSDENWLNAIKKYDLERRETNRFRESGGARELSHILQKQVTKDPVRFAKLGLHISYSSNEAYLESILRGIGDTEHLISIKQIESILNYCHNHPDKLFGKEIAYVVLKHSKKEFSGEVLDIVSWYALNSNDPTTERDAKTEVLSSGVEKEYDELHTIGINSVRGTATEALAHLIYADNKRFEYLKPTIEELISDPSPSVKSCVITVLRIMTNFNRDLAVDLFLKIIESDKILLTVSEVERFIYVIYRTHYNEVEQILELMIDSVFDRTQLMGARQICLSALSNSNAHELALKCINGSKNQRVAAAQIYSKNLQFGEFQKECAEQLSLLFNDIEDEVRSQASYCFRELDDRTLDENRNLIYDYCDSISYPEKHDDLIYKLKDCSIDLIDETIYMATKFFEKIEDEKVSNNASRYSLAESELSKLILRAYSRTTDDNKKSKCLDFLDKMFSLNVYDLQKEIGEYERR